MVKTMMLISAVMLLAWKPCQGASGNSTGFSLRELANLRPGNINDAIDSLLQSFCDTMPSQLPIGDVLGDLAHDCHLSGLEKIHRKGDAFLKIPEETAIFTFGFSTGKMTLKCSWRLWFFLFSASGTVKAHTNTVSGKANMTLEIAPGAHANISEFQVTHLDRIRTEISNAWLLDSIGEAILDLKLNAAREIIITEVERNTVSRLQELLEQQTLPSL